MKRKNIIKHSILLFNCNFDSFSIFNIHVTHRDAYVLCLANERIAYPPIAFAITWIIRDRNYDEVDYLRATSEEPASPTRRQWSRNSLVAISSPTRSRVPDPYSVEAWHSLHNELSLCCHLSYMIYRILEQLNDFYIQYTTREIISL